MYLQTKDSEELDSYVNSRLHRFTSKDEYFKILYYLILKSDKETFEMLFKYIFGIPKQEEIKRDVGGYIFLIMCISYHSVENTMKIPREVRYLIGYLKNLYYIASKFGLFNQNNKEVLDYVNTLAKSFLATGLFIYWEKEPKNLLNEEIIKVYYVSRSDFYSPNESIRTHTCTIKKHGRIYQLYYNDLKIDISKIRVIEEKPSINRFFSIYKAIATTIILAESKYCPFCNPKFPLTKKRSKEANGCNDCSSIFKFISEHGGIEYRSLTNTIQQVERSSAPLLSKIQQKGKKLLKYMENIKSDSKELQIKHAKYEKMIKLHYYLD